MQRPNVIGFFNLRNLSSRPGADTASNRNEYQESFCVAKGCRCVRMTSPPSVSRFLENGEPRRLTTLRASEACYRDNSMDLVRERTILTE
jgi:hypothetical protein